MFMSQHDIQTILYKLNKIETAIDFIQNRLLLPNSQLNQTRTNQNRTNIIDPFAFPQNMNNSTNYTNTTNSNNNLGNTSQTIPLFSFNQNTNQNTNQNLNQNLNQNNRTPRVVRNNSRRRTRYNPTDGSLEISFTNPINPTNNLLTSLFPSFGDLLNTSLDSNSQADTTHRIINQNTELVIFNEEVNENNEETESEVCAICQETIENNTIVRKIKKCNHKFHSACLDRWLENHLTCPTCRQDIRQNNNESNTNESNESNQSINTIPPTNEDDTNNPSNTVNTFRNG
jgi:hypothetical protein